MNLRKALVLFMLLLFSTTASAANYHVGKYTGTGEGRNGEVKVEVTFSDTTIEKVDVISHDETEGVGSIAVEELPPEIIKEQRLDVDAVSGASLTSQAIIDAVTDAVIQAGGNPEDLKKKQVAGATVVVIPVDEMVVYDVVVVGGGASGATAALAAHEKGAKVLMLEKTPSLGGSSKYTDGMLGVGSSMQKKAGVKITPIEVFEKMSDYTHLLFNARLARAFLERSGSTVDWLLSYGIELRLPKEHQQFGHSADEPIIYHEWTAGKEFQTIKKLLEARIEVRYSTEGVEILTDRYGAVNGIKAVKPDGGILTVNAKAVIVATGGYIGNKEMLKEAGIVGWGGLGWQPNDGKGIKMAWDAGAAKYGEKITEYHGTGIIGRDGKQYVGMNKIEALIHVPILWVDTQGVRYYNEDHVYDNALVSHALVSIGGQGLVVFDQAMLDKFTKSKTGLIDSFANIRHIEGKQSGPLPTLQKDVDDAVAAGVAYKGKTLEELAKQAGFDTELFVEQVNNYNKYVKNGKDEQYNKSKTSLMYSVSKGPFYAVEVTTYNLTTIGGIKVNEKLEAVDNNNKPVKGLYAVGNVAGGLYSDSYMLIEGLTLGFATTSGRMAGENSAEYIKQFKAQK